MLAVRIHQHGGPEVLSLDEVPRPALSNSNEVLVAIDLRHAYRKHLSFLGSTIGDRDTFRTITKGFDDGHYQSFVDKVFPLEKIADAHSYLEESRHHGKVVITIHTAEG